MSTLCPSRPRAAAGSRETKRSDVTREYELSRECELSPPGPWWTDTSSRVCRVWRCGVEDASSSPRIAIRVRARVRDVASLGDPRTGVGPRRAPARVDPPHSLLAVMRIFPFGIFHPNAELELLTNTFPTYCLAADSG